MYYIARRNIIQVKFYNNQYTTEILSLTESTPYGGVTFILKKNIANLLYTYLYFPIQKWTYTYGYGDFSSWNNGIPTRIEGHGRDDNLIVFDSYSGNSLKVHQAISGTYVTYALFYVAK